LRADNGLRNRLPISIEWKGSQRAPGDEVAPIDLRVDHVYLVSCKYLSTILVNASPGTSSTTCCGGRTADEAATGTPTSRPPSTPRSTTPSVVASLTWTFPCGSTGSRAPSVPSLLNG